MIGKICKIISGMPSWEDHNITLGFLCVPVSKGSSYRCRTYTMDMKRHGLFYYDITQMEKI